MVVLFAALMPAVAAWSRAGLNVVVDVGHHDDYSKPLGILSRTAVLLQGLPAYFIGVRCPLEVIMTRRDADAEGRLRHQRARWVDPRRHLPMGARRARPRRVRPRGGHVDVVAGGVRRSHSADGSTRALRWRSPTIAGQVTTSSIEPGRERADESGLWADRRRLLHDPAHRQVHADAWSGQYPPTLGAALPAACLNRVPWRLNDSGPAIDRGRTISCSTATWRRLWPRRPWTTPPPTSTARPCPRPPSPRRRTPRRWPPFSSSSPKPVFAAAHGGVHGRHDLVLHRAIRPGEELHTLVETHSARRSKDNLRVTLLHRTYDGLEAARRRTMVDDGAAGHERRRDRTGTSCT